MTKHTYLLSFLLLHLIVNHGVESVCNDDESKTFTHTAPTGRIIGFNCEKLRDFTGSSSNLSIETICNGNGNPNGNEVCPFTCNSACPTQIDENHPTSIQSSNPICEDNDVVTFTHSTPYHIHGFNCERLRNINATAYPYWKKSVCDGDGKRVCPVTCDTCATTMPSVSPTTYAPSVIPTTNPTPTSSLDPSNQPSSRPSLLPSSNPICEDNEVVTFTHSTPYEIVDYNCEKLRNINATAFPFYKKSVCDGDGKRVCPVTCDTCTTTMPSVSPPTDASSVIPRTNPTPTSSLDPSNQPSFRPSSLPSSNPSPNPTSLPSVIPTTDPTTTPSSFPSSHPSFSPSGMPSAGPSSLPSSNPSSTPSDIPSSSPSVDIATIAACFHRYARGRNVDELFFDDILLFVQCYNAHSLLPSISPSSPPSLVPSKSSVPSPTPSTVPSFSPSLMPSAVPSSSPSLMPSATPSIFPSSLPSTVPSKSPSTFPSSSPSLMPSSTPSIFPSSLPSTVPSVSPSFVPTTSQSPSSLPSVLPTHTPSAVPSILPSQSVSPSSVPSSKPSSIPSSIPSSCSNRIDLTESFTYQYLHYERRRIVCEDLVEPHEHHTHDNSELAHVDSQYKHVGDWHIDWRCRALAKLRRKCPNRCKTCETFGLV